MTSSTTTLGLTTYNTVLDSASLVDNYINTVSGSGTSGNLYKIDTFAGQTNSSFANLSSIFANLSSISIISSASSGVPKGKVLSSGSGVLISLDSNASLIYTNADIASAAQVSSGSSSTKLVSASGLAHSNYGKRTAEITLNTFGALVGTEQDYIRIPSDMNGWVLIDASGAVSGSSTSGSPTFLVQRTSASSITPVNMLTNNIMVDQGEYDSSTSGTPSSISTTASSVWTGDKIWAKSSGSTTCGTGVTGAKVSLTFQNLP